MKIRLLSLMPPVLMAFFSVFGQGPWEGDVSHDTGEVLNIWCWNGEFAYCMEQNYPGYKDNGDGTGTIGDVTVNWILRETYDMSYQNELDEALAKQSSADCDDKVDIFLVEADYAPKYTNAEGVCVSMRELGVEGYMFDQYRYTKAVVTDDRGNVNGSSWTANPGVYVYRRSAAKQVFGTDDPAEVQKYFSDWDKFARSAERLSDEGWKILSGYDDAYRVYAQNVSAPWVVDGEIRIDPNLMRWVEQTKDFTDKGYNNRTTLWSVEWMEGMNSSGDVFGYFGPGWFIDYSMEYMASTMDDYTAEPEDGNGTWGDWAAIEGPQPFFWGGYWLCVAQGSDNTGLAADIIYQLTCNEEAIEDAMTKEWSLWSVWPFCNNRKIMERLAEEGMSNEFLGGQNVTEQYIACAEDIRIKHGTAYDWMLGECFEEAMMGYFENRYDLDAALDNFYEQVETLYPELIY